MITRIDRLQLFHGNDYFLPVVQHDYRKGAAFGARIGKLHNYTCHFRAGR